MGALARPLAAIAEAMGLHSPVDRVRARGVSQEPPVLLVRAKVHNLLRRGVPVNRLDPGPTTHTARVAFADGSVAVVRSVPEGRLGSVAVACMRTRVTARPAAADSGGDVIFDWNGGQVLIELMGPDQPD